MAGLAVLAGLAAGVAAAQVPPAEPGRWPFNAPLPGGGPGASPLGSVVVEGNGLAREVACEGRDAVLRGERNRVAFLGPCAGLEVQGNRNAVRAELAPGAPVMLRGEDIELRWRLSAPGPAPRVRAEGQRIRAVAE